MSEDLRNGNDGPQGLVERLWDGIFSALTPAEFAALSALRKVDGSRPLFAGVARLAAAIERQAEQSATATTPVRQARRGENTNRRHALAR